MVICEPNSRKIAAISTPTTPPPTTRMCFGRYDIFSVSSARNTLGPGGIISNPGGRGTSGYDDPGGFHQLSATVVVYFDRMLRDQPALSLKQDYFIGLERVAPHCLEALPQPVPLREIIALISGVGLSCSSLTGMRAKKDHLVGIEFLDDSSDHFVNDRFGFYFFHGFIIGQRLWGGECFVIRALLRSPQLGSFPAGVRGLGV